MRCSIRFHDVLTSLWACEKAVHIWNDAPAPLPLFLKESALFCEQNVNNLQTSQLRNNKEVLKQIYNGNTTPYGTIAKSRSLTQQNPLSETKRDFKRGNVGPAYETSYWTTDWIVGHVRLPSLSKRDEM